MGKFLRVCQFLGRLIIFIVYLCLAATYGKLHPAYIVLCSIGILFGSIASDFMEGHNGMARIVVFLIGFAFVIIPSFIQNITVLSVRTNYYQATFFMFCALWEFIIWITSGEFDTTEFGMELGALGIAIVYSFLVHIFCYNLRTSIFYFVGGLVILLIMLIKRLTRGSALMY